MLVNFVSPGSRFYLSPNLSGGAGGASDKLADSVIKSGETLLTLDQLRSICGGVHPFEYAQANGIGLDGGGKSVYAVEFPAGSKLSGKWAAKVWEGTDPVQDKEKLENELIARIFAKHICPDPNLVFTQAYGSEDKRNIIISSLLEGYDSGDPSIAELRNLKTDSRAQLYAFSEIAPLREFTFTGAKYNESKNKLGLFDFEPFEWKSDSSLAFQRVVTEPGQSDTSNVISKFIKVASKADASFNSAVQGIVSEWQTKINSSSFQRSLSEELQSKVGLSTADANQVVSVLHRRTGVFAKHVGLSS